MLWQKGKANQLDELVRQYAGSTVIVKVSGSNLEENESNDLETVCRSLAAMNVLLQMADSRLIAVHGAGPQIHKTIEAAGLQNRKVDELTYTDSEIYKAVEWAVEKVRANFARNLGIYGTRAEMLPINFVIAVPIGEKYGGRVGKPLGIDYEMLRTANNGSVPIASSWGIDIDGCTRYNINSDDVAAIIAANLKPALLINVTSTGGILSDKSNKNSILPELGIEEAEKLATDGMAVKVNAANYALKASPEMRIVITSPLGMIHSLFGKSGTTLTYR